MDVDKAVERDLKRFDDVTTRFETSALVLGFVNLFLAAWVRAPGLEMNPGSGVGLGLSGFNVGYAIVFGPLVSFMTMLYYLSLLSRRDVLRSLILAQASSVGVAVLSAGERLALGVADAVGKPVDPPLAERAWRAIWCIVVPPAAAIVETARYFDFIVDGKSADTLGTRLRVLLLDGRGAGVRPILPDHALEGGRELMAHLPYINPPFTSWAEVVLAVAAVLMAWRASRLHRARPIVDVTGAAAPEIP